MFRKVNSTPPVRCSSQHSLFGLNQVSVRTVTFLVACCICSFFLFSFPNFVRKTFRSIMRISHFNALIVFICFIFKEFLPQLEDTGGTKGNF